MSENEKHNGDPLHMEGDEAPPPGVKVMAAVRWALLGGMTLVAAASVAYWAGAFEPPASSRPAAQVWTCAMHPQIRMDQPGQCPICGMDLVPVERAAAAREELAGHAGSAPTPAAPGVSGLIPITLAPERQQLIGVRTAKALRRKLAPALRTVGFVTPDERRVAHVHTKVSGWVEDLLVSQTGEYVKAGQPMLLLYSPEFLQAEQEYLSARGSGDAPGGGEMLESARRRLELLDVTPGEIAALEESGRPLRTLTVRSHLSGYVFAKNIAHGMYVQPGTEMFTVVNLGNLWVLADVYEQEIAFVRAGQQAEMRAAAFPGQVFKGRVHFVYPTVAQQTRTLKVRLEFPNPGLKLRPGMYGDVEIRLDAAEGLVAPAEAVVNTGEQTYVFVARGAGRFEPRAVTVGRRDGEMVEVLSGLAEGDEVVTSASFLIDSESRLKAAMQGMGAMPGGHAGHAGAPSDGGAP